MAFAAALPACRPTVKENAGQLKYFDIKGFFKADSARLTREHKLITKTVAYNGNPETKKVYIDNWGREFELFTSSDINKPAWRDSYTIQSSNNGIITYKANSPDLKTSEIMVKKDGDKVKWILIFNYTKNMLYENSEKLTYYPDSAYIIVKAQTVRLLGKNLYVIKGKFN